MRSYKFIKTLFPLGQYILVNETRDVTNL